MSNNKNLYALLGNDVSDDEAEIVSPPKEIVKKTTSSKKVDAPPPSADKSRAKKNGKPAVTGNEAGAKFKNKNADVEAPKTTERRSAKSSKDRHSRTGKTETAKSQKAKLGDIAEAQIEAEADAEEEIAAEEETEPEPVYQTLDDYFSQLSVQQQGLVATAKRTANAGAEDKWTSDEVLVKEREVLIPASATKQTKQKAKKTKQILDVEVVVADEISSRPPREQTSRNTNVRGRGRGPKPARGGKAPAGGKASAGGKKTYNENDFPAL